MVGAREHVLKNSRFLYDTSWLEHFREVPPKRKRSYLTKFSRRFPRISYYLLYIKILRDLSQLPQVVKQLNPAVVLVDDKLQNLVKDLNVLIVPEKSIRYKHHKRLMLIADNLANYFRIILKNDPKRFREELREFER